MPEKAVMGTRLMIEQVLAVIDGKIEEGKITIAKGTNGHMA
jgi:hypothetical protein